MRRRFACGAAVAAAACVLALAPTASAAVHVHRILRGLASPVYVTAWTAKTARHERPLGARCDGAVGH
jgi:hypothetical protein